MNPNKPVIRLLLALLLLAGTLQFSQALPPPGKQETPKSSKPMASKPKLAPRPLPGTSGNASPVPTPVTTSPTVRRAPTSSSAAAAPAAEEAHVLKIYRSGTFEPLPAEPAPPEPKVSGEAQPASPQLPALPRAGEVKIISKAEADALAAQPHN